MFKILGRIGAFLYDLIETVVMALMVFVVLYLFLFQPHQVKGSSMYPNFHDGEYILTDKITYRLRSPKRGEVIIFKAPGHEEYDYIKRIIALPGETVRIENSKIYINDTFVEETYIPADFFTANGTFIKAGQTITIPENYYFALGDNRTHSSDSREWGLVPFANIVGKAFFRYWPANRIGSIVEAKYPTLTR